MAITFASPALKPGAHRRFPARIQHLGRHLSRPVILIVTFISFNP
jgi:hypothetical protein